MSTQDGDTAARPRHYRRPTPMKRSWRGSATFHPSRRRRERNGYLSSPTTNHACSCRTRSPRSPERQTNSAAGHGTPRALAPTGPPSTNTTRTSLKHWSDDQDPGRADDQLGERVHRAPGRARPGPASRPAPRLSPSHVTPIPTRAPASSDHPHPEHQSTQSPWRYPPNASSTTPDHAEGNQDSSPQSQSDHASPPTTRAANPCLLYTSPSPRD